MIILKRSRSYLLEYILDPITDLKIFASSKGIKLKDRSLIEAEVTELRAAKKTHTQEEIKENFDHILLDIENDMYELYKVYEEEYGKTVIETFFQYLIGTKEITDLHNAGKAIALYFKVFDKFFLSLAQSRKNRAGKTFENIHNTLFKMLEYPFDEHHVINGKPDFIYLLYSILIQILWIV